jgi:UDP-2-acetamido-2-deoxy-ribo-hexuluronate aminotransferase
VEFIDLAAQQRRISDGLHRRIRNVLSHGKYILGPEVAELEEKLAAYVGVRYCLSVANGTDALQIAMMALGIQPGDEVITTPFSFIATVETIVLLGAKPVFVDIDEATYNLDPLQIEKAITPKTKLILPVSLYGQCADMDAIAEIAERHRIPVLEDGAQSFGAIYKGRKSCGLSLLGTTSFFPSKPLGCYGDGGACFTNDDVLAKKIREIRVHGQDRRYHHPRLGVNSRLDTLQAAILLAKLEVFEDEVNLRSKIGARYSDLLCDLVKIPTIAKDRTSVYAQYTIEVDARDAVEKGLNSKGVPTAVHYPIPLHLQPVFQGIHPQSVKLKNAERAASRVLSLPMHPYLSAEEQDNVVSALKAVRN